MATSFIDPGLLRRRAVLEAPEEQPDALGGAEITWREVQELSVHVEPVSARVLERFGRLERTVTHRVICRFHPSVTAGRAFRLKERRLLILTVIDPEERGRYLTCRCEEERA